MAENRIDETIARRLSQGLTLAALAAVVGIAYGCDRAYRRWLEEISPLTAPRERIDRMRTGYEERRQDLMDVAQVIGAVLDEVARAMSTERGPSGS